MPTSRIRAAKPPPELHDRLDQAGLLRDPRTRALWPRLTPEQRQTVLDPRSATGHRYPLTSGEVAQLTGLSERQVRYWADHGLIAHWRKGRRRLFEAVGLIGAFGLANSSQHERQFYRGLMEEPIDELEAKIGILTSLLSSRLQNTDADQAQALATALHALTAR